MLFQRALTVEGEDVWLSTTGAKVEQPISTTGVFAPPVHLQHVEPQFSRLWPFHSKATLKILGGGSVCVEDDRNHRVFIYIRLEFLPYESNKVRVLHKLRKFADHFNQQVLIEVGSRVLRT